MGDCRGVSVAVTLAVAGVVTLFIAVLAGYAFIQNMNTSRQAYQAQMETEKIKLSERLTLIYWAPNGLAYIANDGQTRVVIVKAYVDGIVKNLNVVIDPGQIVKVNVGVGSSLAIETSNGVLHILKR